MPRGPFKNYREAEHLADEIAGDNDSRLFVVEDFGLGDPGEPDAGEFFVMSPYEAELYLKTHDGEIQYDANHEPEHFRDC